jgi:hypothetical protein
VVKRAIFVLTSPEAGEQFLRVLPDLREIGLSEATVLHIMPAHPGPAEPMPDLANWVRHFEAAIPKVELALKRGDPVRWIYELARVRRVEIVVISGVPNGTEWDFERVSSPLRRLGIPILFLPDEEIEGSLKERILVAVKAPETLERAVPRLRDWLGSDLLRAIRVTRSKRDGDRKECSGVQLETIQARGDVATTLLQQAQECRATLVTILAEEEAPAGEAQSVIPVVKPLIETTDRPVLIWPAA